MNKRRQVIIAISTGLLAAPFSAFAQQPAGKIRRIGLLSPYVAADSAVWYEAFRLALRDRGWIEGKNISIDYRYAEGKRERIPDLMTELVGLKVDVIVTAISTEFSVAHIAAKASPPIPVVTAAWSDPLSSGMVESLARPGGNITGLSQMSYELAGKRLELLKEMVPKLARVAVLRGSGSAVSDDFWKSLKLPARQLGLQLQSLEVRNTKEFEKAFADAVKARAGALLVLAFPLIVTNLKRIVDLAAKNRLPSIFQWSEFTDAGGLASFGPDRTDMFRRAAIYVDKILNGAKPGTLPIEQPTTFETVINMKTAKALGLKIPNSILVRATRVIE
jgi:putative ABC transport system substrate-binding protein